MRGVANQRDAAFGIVLRQLAAQRECRAFRDGRQRAQACRRTQASSSRRKRGFVHVQQPRRFRFRQRPHDRAAMAVVARLGARKGKKGQRPGRQETLPAGRLRAGVRMIDEGDQAVLAVVVGVGSMPASERSFESPPSAASTRRARRRVPLSSSSAAWSSSCSSATTCSGAQHAHAGGRQRGPQAIDQQPVLDDPAQFATAEGIGIETQLVATGRVPHAHATIRAARARAHRGPHAQIVEQRRIVGREGVHAQVGRVGAPAAAVRAPRPAPPASHRGQARAPRRHRRRPRRQRRHRAGRGGSCGTHGHRLAPTQGGHVAAIAHRRADQERLRRRQAIGGEQAEAAQRPHSCELLEVIRASPSENATVRSRSLATPLGVARQQGGGATIECASPVVRAACSRADSISSASVSASRNPRLNPCAPIGWMVCAALPTNTARDAVKVDASMRVIG